MDSVLSLLIVSLCFSVEKDKSCHWIRYDPPIRYRKDIQRFLDLVQYLWPCFAWNEQLTVSRRFHFIPYVS
ncbi:hypothetical protein BDY19DRAFT_731291 [Irpex rosettiformis]|uniref:Uncharacterized protein n=1 Tax=Irpex rosettiformis TaxID=378272 RepID=A0ACB8U932_9APHY|nr:hypothetical protein BDY19DRAFT_731291 [Irpex rosettiformis]